MGGTWTIPIYTEQGWTLLMGQQGDLLGAPLDIETGTVEMAEVFYLSNRQTLSDHSLRKCPDETYLHIASESENSANFIFRYDKNFQLLWSGELPQTSPPHAANDVPAICGNIFQGAAIAQANGILDYFVPIDAQAQPQTRIELQDAPRMTGAGLMEWDSQLFVISQELGPSLHIASYNSDFSLLEKWEVPPISSDIKHYWPSRILPIGDYFLVATMGRDPTLDWSMDTGDLYLLILDRNFAVVEWHQLSHNDLQQGGMRPWMEYHEDVLLVGYDKQTSLFLYRIELDLETFGVDLPTEEENNWHVGLKEEETKCGGLSTIFFCGLWLALHRRQNNLLISPA